MRRLLLVLLVVVVVAIVVGWTMFPRDGFSARGNPSALETFAAKTSRKLSLPRNARDKKNPVQVSPDVLKAGMLHFADHCATCHANDGSGRTKMGKNMYPKVPDMRKDTQNLTDGEIYYIIENGIRLTGMPAWGKGGDDDKETWQLVHFVRHLPKLSNAEQRQMKAANPMTDDERQELKEEEEFLNGSDSQADSHSKDTHEKDTHDKEQGRKH